MDFGELESAIGFGNGDSLIIQSGASGKVKQYPFSTHFLYNANNLITNWDGLKTSIVRGQNLGTAVTDEQWEEIRNGTFRNMFLGDFWEIGDHRWVIMDFDYWYRGTSSVVKDHHVVLMPQAILYNMKWNSEENTNGGYFGSTIRTTGLDNAKSMIVSAFGDSHLLRKKELLSNSVTTNVVTGNIVVENSIIELPNEAMIFGNMSYSSRVTGMNPDHSFRMQNPDTYEMYPLMNFILNRKSRRPLLQNFWLRDIAGGALAVACFGYGSSFGHIATDELGVRPVFAIKG